MWAKISNSATSMACAACLAVAATLPWAGSAAEKLATEDLRLAAITDIDAFSAIPSIIDVLNGDLTALADLDSLSAIPSIIALLGGDTSAVNDLDSVNGIPALLDLAGGDINTLFPDDTNPTSGYDALSAIDIFFGDGANAEGGVISDGNFDGLSNYDALSALPAYRTLLDPTSTTQERLDALGGLDSVSAIPVFAAVANASTPTEAIDALAGYDALSALPVFFGSNGVISTGNLSSLAPDAAGNGGYAALSAIPKYLNLPTNPAPAVATTFAAPQTQAKVADDPAPTVKTFVAALPKPKDFTPPAPLAITPPAPQQDPPKVEEAAAVTSDNGANNGPELNVNRNSNKYTPKGIGGDNPLLFGSGTPGVDNGIRGWGDGLKKLGIGGGDQSSSSDSGTK